MEERGTKIKMKTRIRRSTPTCHESNTADNLSRSSSRTSLSTIPISNQLPASGRNNERIKVVVASRNDITKMTEKVVEEALDTRCEQMMSDFEEKISTISMELASMKTERENVKRENRTLRNRLDDALNFYSDGEAMMRKQDDDLEMTNDSGKQRICRRKMKRSRDRRGSQSAGRERRAMSHPDGSPVDSKRRIVWRSWRSKDQSDSECRLQTLSSSDSRDNTSHLPPYSPRLTRRKR